MNRNDTPNEKPKDDALTVLRTETALSRFPLHRLTKGKNVQIELENQASAVLWRIDHNSHYGQPGALAYKIDSIFINRRLEENGRPVPKTIRLGSLREIALEVGSGTNTTPVKKALLQNATASITAKISYRIQGGGEQWLEAVFNRYSVVFTGEKLPSGDTADAVYLVLNDVYQQLLNSAVYRPLNYEYMKSLPPISQRFYEIASYQVFAALKHRNPRAKIAYSEYCLLSTATRYFDFEHVKKQMYKILRPHIKSGYLAKVEYETTTNDRGELDWMMYLTPGPNAGQEFDAFTGAGQMRKPKTRTKDQAKKQNQRTDRLRLPFPESTTTSMPPETLGNVPTRAGEATEASFPPSSETQELIEALIAADLNRGDAARFALEKPEVCRRQLSYLPFVESFKTSRGAYLRRAIEGDFGPPAAYSKALEKQAQEQSGQRRRALELFEAAEKNARQKHEEGHQEAFAEFLTQWVGELEKTQPEAFTAFTEYEAEKRRILQTGPLANRLMTRHALKTFDQTTIRADRILDFCREEGRKFRLKPLTFWEWDEALNPEPFTP